MNQAPWRVPRGLQMVSGLSATLGVRRRGGATSRYFQASVPSSFSVSPTLTVPPAVTVTFLPLRTAALRPCQAPSSYSPGGTWPMLKLPLRALTSWWMRSGHIPC